MTNHEQTLIERKQAELHHHETLLGRRTRRKIRKLLARKPVICNPGRPRSKQRPKFILYFPWTDITRHSRSGVIHRYNTVIRLPVRRSWSTR